MLLRVARKTGFVKRKGRLHPREFVVGLLREAARGMGMTLEGMLECGGCRVSKVALHKRFDAEAVMFLEGLLNSVSLKLYWEHVSAYRRVLGQFGRVLINDSSAWNVSPRLARVFPGSGGNGSPATCKLQLQYELKSGTITAQELVASKVSDQASAVDIIDSAKPGDLCLFDLGYVSHDLLEQLEDNGAYFLCRLRANSTIVDRHGYELSLARLLKKARKHGKNAFEMCADLNGEGLEVRIVASRLSEEQRRKRLRQLKKEKCKKGQKVTAATREFAGWSIYATNAPASILPAPVVSELYRLRWSIELLFRQFKSVLKLDHASHANEHRLRCEVLAKLIVSTIATALHGRLQAILYRDRCIELSIQKVFQLVQRRAEMFFDALLGSVALMRRFFRDLETLILQRCRKQYSRTKPSTLQRIADAASLPNRFRNYRLYGMA